MTSELKIKMDKLGRAHRELRDRAKASRDADIKGRTYNAVRKAVPIALKELDDSLVEQISTNQLLSILRYKLGIEKTHISNALTALTDIDDPEIRKYWGTERRAFEKPKRYWVLNPDTYNSEA